MDLVIEVKYFISQGLKRLISKCQTDWRSPKSALSALLTLLFILMRHFNFSDGINLLTRWPLRAAYPTQDQRVEAILVFMYLAFSWDFVSGLFGLFVL